MEHIVWLVIWKHRMVQVTVIACLFKKHLKIYNGTAAFLVSYKERNIFVYLQEKRSHFVHASLDVCCSALFRPVNEDTKRSHFVAREEGPYQLLIFTLPLVVMLLRGSVQSRKETRDTADRESDCHKVYSCTDFCRPCYLITCTKTIRRTRFDHRSIASCLN